MNNQPALSSAVNQRIQGLIPLIQQLPPVGSRPLTVAGRVAGWISKDATGHLSEQPGIHIEDEAVHITEAPGQHLCLDAVLAQLAKALQGTGCLRGWRDELLDVIGEGQRLAAIERAAMRPLGLLTRAVHLNAWAPDGRLWVARRADSKSSNPGMWDTLVGGLAAAGETLDHSLLRECNEEAGLEPAQLGQRSPLRTILRMHRRLPEGYQVEDVLVSDCVLADGINPCNQDGEVSDISLVDAPRLWAMLDAKEFTVEAELVILDSLRRRVLGKEHDEDFVAALLDARGGSV